jgi:protein-L-isoaspartate(D-aspartate) O-methyltransferase
MTPMTAHSPIPDYAAARQAMVDSQLRPLGVNDPAVIDAMAHTERERFVEAQSRPIAYTDRAVAIGEGRMLSAPAVLGQLLSEVIPQVGQRALVVGAGTGYSAAVLAAMGLRVTGLESSPALALMARNNGVDIAEGPLENGWSSDAPYDLVLVDGAIEYVPDEIAAQIKDGGMIATALIDRGVCRLVTGRKSSGAIGYHILADAGVAALPGFSRPRAFLF